jgi:FkbM family methyltransferase
MLLALLQRQILISLRNVRDFGIRLLGRTPPASPKLVSAAQFVREWRTVEPEFDAAYYRKNNLDVKGIPLAHFLDYGWREGRDPSSSFHVLHYLKAAGDVMRAGVNPLVHYVRHGRGEGRIALRAGLVFRPGTIDASVWQDVVGRNEYGLPEHMPADETVVDVGTHVGSFVQAAWERGARRIFSYEAGPGNFAVACNNVGALDGVVLVNAAVWRSDLRDDAVFHTAHEVYTGAGSVFADGGVPVASIPFDEILSGQTIDFLKIDCEGAEWPILYTADLSRVRRIVGEYHSLVGTERTREVVSSLPRPVSPEALREFLVESGFKNVRIKPHPVKYQEGEFMGHFGAER